MQIFCSPSFFFDLVNVNFKVLCSNSITGNGTRRLTIYLNKNRVVNYENDSITRFFLHVSTAKTYEETTMLIEMRPMTQNECERMTETSFNLKILNRPKDKFEKRQKKTRLIDAKCNKILTLQQKFYEICGFIVKIAKKSINQSLKTNIFSNYLPGLFCFFNLLTHE